MYTAMKVVRLMLIFLVVSLFGCEKIDTKDDGTLYGSWKVSQEVYPFSTYMVNIEKEPAGIDSTIVVINNFQNLGDDVVYCKLKDSTLTIWQPSEVSGTGVYHKSARKISWDYSVFENGGVKQIRATYTKN